MKILKHTVVCHKAWIRITYIVETLSLYIYIYIYMQSVKNVFL